MTTVARGARVLVTGGAGYVGSVLVRRLLEHGYRVRIVDTMLFGRQGIAAIEDRLEVVVADVRRLPETTLDDVAAIINLAGLSNDPMADFQPGANHEMNTVATERIARAARERGIRRFIQASSCSVYDRGLDAEDRLAVETSDVKPRAAYAVSKHEAETTLLELAGDRFCPVILRKGTVFGFSPRMRYDLVVNTFLKDALTIGKLTAFHGGEMWRPLVEVGDVADAYLLVLEADEAAVGGEIFNVVQENYRVSELMHRVQTALRPIRPVEVEVTYGAGAARSYRVSGDKLRRLGFAPRVTVGESVVDMLARIREHGFTDFLHPRYYNIQWFKALLELDATLAQIGGRLL